jgi:prepilin-type processing-associated H-X9-DG protein
MLRTITFSLLLCVLTCFRAGAQDRSTPEATVRSFLAAFMSGDMKQAITCVKGVQIGGAALDALAQQVQKDPASFTLSDAKSTLNGTRAIFTAQVSLKSAKSEKAQNFATQISLESSDGTWQIVPDAVKAQQGDNPDLVNQLAYVLTDPKVFARARDAARATSCLSNMHQNCLGAMILAQDYNEKFKIKAEAYKKSLMPYVKNPAIFKCPSDSGTGDSYAFNANLACVSLAKIHAPAETVLIYEGKSGKLEFRHEGRAAVGFADGHVKLMNAVEAKKLRWKP